MKQLQGPSGLVPVQKKKTWQASICFDPLHDFPTLISLSVSSGTDSFRVEGSAAAYKSKYTPFIQELRTTVLLMDKYTV
jgi:hypothetical protein